MAMTAEQFKQFMDAFKECMPMQPTMQPQVANTQLIASFESFNIKVETFKQYRQRFENYLRLKKVLDDKIFAAQHLLLSIGATAYNILAALVSPKEPKELSYDELVGKLEDYYCPKQSLLIARHKFSCIRQAEGQSIADFAAILRREVADCAFISPCDCKVSTANENLLGQFIKGLRDQSIRDQLLMAKDAARLSFDKALTRAMGLETAKLDSKALGMLTPSSATLLPTSHVSTSADSIPVHKVQDTRTSKSEKRNKSNTRYPDRSRSRNQTSNSDRSRRQSQNRYRRFTNYAELGIQGLCFRCGKNNHKINECQVDRNKLKCNACSKTGHVEKVCIVSLSRKKRDKSVNRVDIDDGEFQQYNDVYGVHKVIDIFGTTRTDNSDASKFMVTVLLAGQPVQFEVDSGAGFTLLPKSVYKSLNLPYKLQETNVAFRSYTKEIFRPFGRIKIPVSYRDSTSVEELFIVPDKFEPLIGRVWIRRLKIGLLELGSTGKFCAPVDAIHNISEITMQFASIFEETIGCVPDSIVSIQLRENVKPIAQRERTVPYALREKVERKLNNLLSLKIIEPVTTCDWGSPLVIIPKADNTVRLCVDYKTGVNKRIVAASFPIKKTEEILNSLRGSRFFCKLDLYRAYLHFRVDEPSSQIQAMVTHKGIFKINRLSFGLKIAPAEFNRAMSKILSRLSKTEVYYDDIIVHGSTYEECYRNLVECLQRLKANDLHLNVKKCSFFVSKIRFLGHCIEYNKISADPAKVTAVNNMPRPESIDDVRRFLGKVQYYAKYIPNVATITYPLRCFLKKNATFRWSKQCDQSFELIKKELTSNRVLVPYDPNLPIVVACDASPVGVAGVLSHIIEGEERPFAYASRSLTTAEKNYSQLDREALAIVYSVNHFYMYLIGRHFTLITDNQPLTRIFHEDAKLPAMTAGRLLRYAAFLSGFDYHVQYKKGVEHANVDCLSRAPDPKINPTTDVKINTEVHQILESTVYTIVNDELSPEMIRTETRKDEELSSIKNELKSDSKAEQKYVLNNDLVFYGDRIVIPKSLRSRILAELHCTHSGATKMKQLARRYCYWQGIDRDIEEVAKACTACIETKSAPKRVPVHPWELPTENWSRLHIDYAGPFQGYHLLIVVDARSKWLEVKPIRDAPTAAITIKLLRELFVTHGLPDSIVSDNATYFTSDEFVQFCRENGIYRKLSAPGHPSTNGLAERNVQTVKNYLKAVQSDGMSMYDKVNRFLVQYRATPSKDGSSPSERYLNRRFRIKLDLIRPAKPDMRSIDNCTRKLRVGDRVAARCIRDNVEKWLHGIVRKKYGELHYLIELDSGRTLKKHINQLKASSVKKKVTFSLPEERSETQESHRQELSEIVWPMLTPMELPATPIAVNVGANQPSQPVVQQDQTVRRSTRLREAPRHLANYHRY